MMDLDRERLAALGAVVTEGSFDAAARQLHVTPSAISQRIRALELAVGRVLVTRGRPVRATPSGAILVRAARQMEAIAADAIHALSVDTPAGAVTVPLAVNADSLATWLLPALAGLADVVVALHREDQDRTADLLREGLVWAAVTASPDPVPGCRVEPLGTMRYHACAAPDFARRHFPDGVERAALATAPVVNYDRDDRLQDRFLELRVGVPPLPPRHYVPSSEAFVTAVRLGMGWGMVPDLQARDLPKGCLTVLDPEGAVDVALYWAQPRRSTPTLERVAAAVRTAARRELG